MINNKNILSNISNDKILKNIFSYIEYNYTLKLLKENNSIRKRIGINLDNYNNSNNKSDYPKYEFTKEKKFLSSVADNEGPILSWISSFLICPIFIYILIYSILLVSLKSFDDSNTKKNYNKSSAKIIKTINACTFILVAAIPAFGFSAITYIFNNYQYELGIHNFIKSFLMILFNIISFGFEGLIIWKLILSYEIKKDSIRWFMVMDYIFIFINIIYIIVQLFFTIIFFATCGRLKLLKKNVYTLISINDIKIRNYQLKNFEYLKENERKKVVFDNYENYQYKVEEKQTDLINLINDFRHKNKIAKLEIDKDNRIPEFIFKKESREALHPKDNICEISNKEYLFRFPVGKFENLFKNKDEKILEILLKDNLNYIQIFNQGETEYIYIQERHLKTVNERIKWPMSSRNSENLLIMQN